MLYEIYISAIAQIDSINLSFHKNIEIYDMFYFVAMTT